MDDKEIKENALKEMKKHGIFERLSEYGKPLFVMVAGAHNFGFPSHDSDWDIRGVYQCPTKELFGLRKKVDQPTFEYMSEAEKLDVSIDEVGHFMKIVSESNGNRIEWPHSNLMIYTSSEFPKLKEATFSTLSKGLLNHYLHFARDMWEGKTKEEGVKKDLYALRVYMSGISLFEDGVINSNINQLNKKFGEDIVDQMIKIKAQGEKTNSNGYDREALEKIISGLDARLLRAAENSTLPAYPNVDKINSYLKDLRMRYLE